MYNDEPETLTETALAATTAGTATGAGTATTAPTPLVPEGERLIAGRYRLLSRLGEGGMGTVWRARDETLHREVAVKEVRAPAGLRADDIARMYSRLEREAWAAARIPDRNVVTVHDVVMEDDRPWIVMELVRGQSLADLLRAGGPLTPRHAAHIGAQVLSALRAAHAVGVEHRDVKPANVLLAEDGRVVLSDFGIAMVEGSTALTITGEVVGSPEYLPPERALGRPSGPESDLWSLGVLLYAAVEGVSPFRQDTALSTLRAVVDEEPPVPARAGPIAPVIAGLLRKEPAERTPAAEVAAALRDIAHEPDATTAAGLVLPTPGDAATAAAAATTAGAPTRTEPAVAGSTPLASAPLAADAPAPVPPAPPRKRRTAAFVAAGAAVCVLIAAAGLVHALTGGDEDTAADSGVRMSVAGANTTYTGRCPTPANQAPAFTATFTASQPTLISYRWVSGDGSVVDPHWRTMSIGDKANPTGHDTVRLTTYAKSGTLTTGMAVELQSPTRTTSNPVPFSITCTG
ncbi:MULTISPECIES: serine/threonine-protein kinase [unclassified Streptomyces]|uniref:serine/threonine-protein kinase n=1 Tax=unclassified Streptomyces TaxID=2593676 RepID=UPI0022596D3C|nr:MULTISPECIES: serine/threonine-protein kinase [unclassified Streptomyces]MCX4524168.1 serine/threonine protein kinase [Streptomyces sp. NBC_01551]MCX4545313.1 serine/threonine protein kinase [Streptomyces sp. NBC_01565]